MKNLSKKVYVAAGYNTLYLGPGRKEFNPKHSLPTFEQYLLETAKGTLSQCKNEKIDEGIISNFMAGRFIKQGNLPGFLPEMIPSLQYQPCTRVEGACGSGGLAIATAIKSVLANFSETVFVTGFEIQNIVKAVYGADYLAGAAYFNGERKQGHAHFFPNIFSQRAGAYFQKFGRETARKAMATWYVNAIENARKNPKAQEFQNTSKDLQALALTEPNPSVFLEHINFYDCSKISDGASSLLVCDENGLKNNGITKDNALEVVGFAMAEGNITRAPQDPTIMDTTQKVVAKALQMAQVTINDIAFVELHDCFTISGLLALEALQIVPHGKGPAFILDGNIYQTGKLPVNLSGGLIGFGHPTGATGVRQMVDLWQQQTQQAPNQLQSKKEFALMVSMGGNDKTLTCFVTKRA